MSIMVFTVYQCGHGESGDHLLQAKGHKILQGSNKYSSLPIKKKNVFSLLCERRGLFSANMKIAL